MDIISPMAIVAISILPFFVFTNNAIAAPIEQEINSLLNNQVCIESKEINVLELKDGASEKWVARMKMIDKYDELILDVARQEQINPQMLKIIISLESNGKINSINHNSNGSSDYGLTQINNKSWGNYFDYKKLLVDARYGIECSAKVIKMKMKLLKNLKREVTIANVFHAYNGLSNRGLVYKKKTMEGYGQFKYPINEVIWDLERR